MRATLGAIVLIALATACSSGGTVRLSASESSTTSSTATSLPSTSTSAPAAPCTNDALTSAAQKSPDGSPDWRAIEASCSDGYAWSLVGGELQNQPNEALYKAQPDGWRMVMWTHYPAWTDLASSGIPDPILQKIVGSDSTSRCPPSTPPCTTPSTIAPEVDAELVPAATEVCKNIDRVNYETRALRITRGMAQSDLVYPAMYPSLRAVQNSSRFGWLVVVSYAAQKPTDDAAFEAALSKILDRCVAEVPGFVRLT
jgi:hypothetical protein